MHPTNIIIDFQTSSLILFPATPEHSHKDLIEFSFQTVTYNRPNDFIFDWNNEFR